MLPAASLLLDYILPKLLYRTIEGDKRLDNLPQATTKPCVFILPSHYKQYLHITNPGRLGLIS